MPGLCNTSFSHCWIPGVGIGFLVLCLLLGMAACGSKAPAGPKIKVENVWSRPGMMGGQSGAGGMGHNMAGTGAVFMTLKNEGREADRLLNAQTDVAQAVEIHETVVEGDVAKMQQVSGGIEVPAQGQVELKPGGYHVMLIGLLRDLAVGDRFAVTLNFEKSGDLTVEAEVRQP
jgi:copper(I)-binding protein